MVSASYICMKETIISSFGRRLASDGQRAIRNPPRGCFLHCQRPHRLTCSHKYILHSRIDCWRVISYSPTERWCPQMLAIHTKLLISGWSPGARTTSMEANLSLLRSYVHRFRASRNTKFTFKYGIFGERLKENVR